MSWSIRELADHYGITLRTLRHYEELGLLSPAREGTRRLYRQRERTRLELILRGKRVGFSLEEIKVIVDMYDEPPGEAGQLRYLIEQCEARRGSLLQQQRDIEQTLDELDRIESRCRAALHEDRPNAVRTGR